MPRRPSESTSSPGLGKQGESPPSGTPLSREEQARLQKARTLSDAELIVGGAEYVVDAEGATPRLELTMEQIERLRDSRTRSGGEIEQLVAKRIEHLPKLIERSVGELRRKFEAAIAMNEFKHAGAKKDFPSQPLDEIRTEAKQRVGEELDRIVAQLRLESGDSLSTLLSIISPHVWYYNAVANKYLQQDAAGKANEVLMELAAPIIIQALPEKARDALRGARVVSANAVGGRWAILAETSRRGGRYVISDSEMWRIPNAFGYPYLDINPNLGLPFARSRYADEDQRGFFDGIRMMSLPEFRSCAPAVVFNDEGYRVRVQSTSDAQSIINGYLYPSYQREFDLAIRDGFFGGREIGTKGVPAEFQAKEQEAFQHVRINPDHTLQMGDTVVHPIGRFEDAETERDADGFLVVRQSKFTPFGERSVGQ